MNYSTIVVDPPWKYTKDPTERGPTMLRGVRGASAEHYYPTMTTEEIAALPVASYASEQAHLYLWVTNPVLLGHRPGIAGRLTPLEIVRIWGFDPTSLLTWHKLGGYGLGWYWRGDTEQVIFAVRGGLQIPPADRVSNHFAARRGRHSEKPDRFYEIVEAVSPGPRLELFARRRRVGWDVMGDEAPPESEARTQLHAGLVTTE